MRTFQSRPGQCPIESRSGRSTTARYGLDATFQGASGYERAGHHEEALRRVGVKHSFRQELDGGWTLRFGPLRAMEIASALSAFVY
jgi:hypothetical protein